MTTRSKNEVLTMLAQIVTEQDRGDYKSIGCSPESGHPHWITDEERNQYKADWRAAGFFVMSQDNCTYGVSASKDLFAKIGHFRTGVPTQMPWDEETKFD